MPIYVEKQLECCEE